MKVGTAARCHPCNKRRALPRLWRDYVRDPKCLRCGRALRVDKYRMLVEYKQWKAATCTDATCLYSFPHRRGSKYCSHHPDFEKHASEHYHYGCGHGDEAGDPV